MKRLVITILAIIFSNNVFCSNVQVYLVKPEKFFDLKADDSDSNEKLQNRFVEAITGEISSLIEHELGKDKNIAVAIYDVDLAGSLNMVSYFGQMRMTRIISESTPARLNISYIFVDKDGKEINSGAEILSENFHNYNSYRSNNFEQERKLLRSWLSKQLD